MRSSVFTIFVFVALSFLLGGQLMRDYIYRVEVVKSICVIRGEAGVPWVLAFYKIVPNEDEQKEIVALANKILESHQTKGR